MEARSSRGTPIATAEDLAYWRRGHISLDAMRKPLSSSLTASCMPAMLQNHIRGLIASQPTIAQTSYPIGVATVGPQCAPDSVPSSTTLAKPDGEWIKISRAIAGADETTQAWASTGMPSKKV
ncbi:hypothetical protein AB7M18_000961 [Pseudomonas viridiflava]|uniref:hypothetical protein n=1 Tax=Pseudomonas syringae TaxID=317 RepID=UPI001864F3E5|nr:hypothetical protein [Pseudomonas syringae]